MLEQALGKDLLYLACRDNVIEHLSAAAYKTTMGASSEPGIVDKIECSMILEETSQRMMQFATNNLQKT